MNLSMLHTAFGSLYPEMASLISAFEGGELLDADQILVRNASVVAGRVRRMEVCVGGIWVECGVPDSKQGSFANGNVSTGAVGNMSPATKGGAAAAESGKGDAAATAVLEGSQISGAGNNDTPSSMVLSHGGRGSSGQGPSGTAMSEERARSSSPSRKRLKIVGNVSRNKTLDSAGSEDEPVEDRTPSAARQRRLSRPSKAITDLYITDMSVLEDDVEVEVRTARRSWYWCNDHWLLSHLMAECSLQMHWVQDDTKRRYTVEAFVDMRVNADLEIEVQVKYEDHDEMKWETLSYMKTQMTAKAIDELLTPLRAKAKKNGN